VVGVRSRQDRLEVYNLAVLGLPYYAVGPLGILVHNSESNLPTRNPAPGTPTPKVDVRGEPLVDPVRKVGIRTGLYDSETGTVHVGGGEGHRSVARNAGIGDKSGTNISGLEIVEGEDWIAFRDRSGWYDRRLTPVEQEGVRNALESRFGKPVTYDPDLGQVNRPGGAPK
jgi:hypothetical protein